MLEHDTNPFEKLGFTHNFIKKFYLTVGRENFKDFLSKFVRISLGALHPDRTGKDELFRQVSDAYENLITAPSLKVLIREYDSKESGENVVKNLISSLEKNNIKQLAAKKKAIKCFISFLELMSQGDVSNNQYNIFNIIPCRLRLFDRDKYETEELNFVINSKLNPLPKNAKKIPDNFFYYINCPSIGKIILKMVDPPKEYIFDNAFLIGVINDKTEFSSREQKKTLIRNLSKFSDKQKISYVNPFINTSIELSKKDQVVFPIGERINIKKLDVLDALSKSGGVIKEYSRVIIMLKLPGGLSSYYLLPELSKEKAKTDKEKSFISPLP